MISTLTGSESSVIPRGQLSTPWAPSVRQSPRKEEVANYPPGNPGCTPEEAGAVSAGRQKNARHARARTGLKGPRSHTCPPRTPEVWEGRPRATEQQASAGAPPLSDRRHTAPRSEWRATRRSPSGTHSEECVAQRLKTSRSEGTRAKEGRTPPTGLAGRGARRPLPGPPPG